MTQQSDRPRRGRPGYDQETVLRRAIELFNERGYDATSVAELARDLGLTKSAIFHHVASKDDLLAAALDEALTALSSTIDAAVATHADSTAAMRLRATVAQSVLVLVAHLPSVTLLLRVRGNSPVEQEALRRRRVIDDTLTRLVRDAVAEGSLRDDIAPEAISRLLFGTVNSLVEWYRPGGTLTPDQLAETVATLAFDGLLRR
ncbi:MAG: TetR/AcrR family transcriptional regulator [Marmoricola sp.]